MSQDSKAQLTAASSPPFQFTSEEGDLLTIDEGKFPTVLLRQSVRTGGDDLLWTIRSVGAHCLLNYAHKIGFDFSVTAFFHPHDRVWVPVLKFRTNTGTLAYTIGLIGDTEFPEFFAKFADIDLLVADTAITTRDRCTQLPVPPAVFAQLSRDAAKFHSGSSQKGTIEKINKSSP